MNTRISSQVSQNTAKPQHSTAFLKSLNSLTKSKPKSTSSQVSKDPNSSSQDDYKNQPKLQETPRKTRGKEKAIYGSSSSSEDLEQSLQSFEVPSNLAQQIAKPKFFMPSQSSILRPKAKQFRVKEIENQTISSFEFYCELENRLYSNIVHQIMIKDQKFNPEILKIQQGDTVEWQLCTDSINDDYSLYYEISRSHVIRFDEVGFEAPLVRISNRGVADPTKTTFRITFKEPGIFEFACRIYTWMKGKVEVYNQINQQDASISQSTEQSTPTVIQSANTTLLQAAINSEKAQIKQQKKSPIIDFKEVFGLYGNKMRPEDVIHSDNSEDDDDNSTSKKHCTPTLDDIMIDPKQIELEEEKFLAEQRQSKRTGIIRNSSGSNENPSAETSELIEGASDYSKQKQSTSRRRDFQLAGRLSPPKESSTITRTQISVTDDERKYEDRRNHLNCGKTMQSSQKKEFPINKLNQYSLLFHSSSTTSATREHSGTQRQIPFNLRQTNNFHEFQLIDHKYQNGFDDHYYPSNRINSHLDNSSAYSQSLDHESITSESSAVDTTSEQLNSSMIMGGHNNYRYSKNPFAHLATASWQPFTGPELVQIYKDRDVSQYNETDYLNQDELQRQEKLKETQSRKKLKKKQYQKRKTVQKNDLAKPCDFDIMFMAAFSCEKSKRENPNNSRILDAYQDDFDNIQIGASPPIEQINQTEGFSFPLCGLQAMMVSERDQFHLQTATDRIRTMFDQGLRGALYF